MTIGRYLSFPLFFLAAVLQTALLPEFQVRGGRADLVLALVVSWALWAGPDEGLLWAIVGGVFLDIAANQTWGSTALALVFVAWGVGNIGQRTGRVPWLPSAVFAAGAVAVYHVLLIGIFLLLGRSVSILDSLVDVTLPTMGLTALLILPIYRFMGLFFRAKSTRRIALE